ncbi:MAG: hypothetical protein K8F91_16305, partial [Candidatus Obscuribacterales bacterium]|nr:hypothetical protein [Candidatus Obscuribacterales bacterium]
MTCAAKFLDLGESFEEKGKYFKAERLYKRALKNVEPGVDELSFELVPYLYNLGMVQAALEKNIEATQNLGRLISILIHHCGEDDVEVREIQMVLSELNPE